MAHRVIVVEDLKQSILRAARFSLGRDFAELSPRERFVAVSLAVREVLIDGLVATDREVADSGRKRVCYLSMEFLAGRLLTNNLINLDVYEPCEEALRRLGVDLEELIEEERDPALGNGGLGRLAACFLDSMATLGVAATGYGINYEFGLFRQAVRNGWQVEQPDVWRRPGNPWLIQRPELSCPVPVFGRVVDEPGEGGATVRRWVETQRIVGVPADVPVVGWQGRAVNRLRLYAAAASEEFDVEIFNAGDYVRAVEQKIRSERISKILYPSDALPAGRELRLLQEYFFVACALHDVLSEVGTTRDDLRRLPDRVAIQLNDTHPALAVAELLRLLIDEHGFAFDEALALTRATTAFTNHTLLPEAQETWPVEMLQRIVPRHLDLIYEVNARFLAEVERRWPGDGGRRERLSIVGENGERHARMAHLSIVGSHSVNGVSKLHTRMLEQRLADHHALWPERFNNKTNGVTQRRWLLIANPALSALLTRHLGADWPRDLDLLRALERHADDAELHAELASIKSAHKLRLARHIEETLGVRVDPASLFDAQIKRIHEYKRQLLNALRIVLDYLALVEDGVTPPVPRTFIFAGKAAPGYATAKLIIKLIHEVARVVNDDRRARDHLRVVFLPDYRVTLAERIIPAADVSEQISTAGMEASGTGNMKFMMNGALTVGTLDGANIEMAEEAGAENLFIFGSTAEEIEDARRAGPPPADLVAAAPLLARALEALQGDRFCAAEPGLFRPLADRLLERDEFFVLRDLEAFVKVQIEVARQYLEPALWGRKCLLNIARSGRFSSDRTIREYARDIWNVPVDRVRPAGAAGSLDQRSRR